MSESVLITLSGVWPELRTFINKIFAVKPKLTV